MTNETPAEQDRSLLSRYRNFWIAALLLVVLAAIAIWLFLTRFSETTEDAYVEGNIVPVTSQVAGTVTDIGADDTDHVGSGAALVKLNASDAELAFENAKASLAKATRNARMQYHQVSQAGAELAERENDLRKARNDLARRLQLVDVGAVTGEEVAHAREVVDSAQSSLEATRQTLAQRRAMVDNVSLSQHPDVLAAASALKAAYVALKRTIIRAPVAGTITKRSVQVGQRIAPGVALMSVVPLDAIWVNANFKESQLQHIRIGQPVNLTADIYGGSIVYHGRIVGLGAGTGSAFALLPAQNATGNWIKVTQRVPVRIALDAKEITRNPLRVGLSMHVDVDTHDRTGSVLASAGKPTVKYGTGVFAKELADADALVARIIAANAGAGGGI